MSAFIGTSLVGIICIVLGISNMRGNISSVHAYHRCRVSEEDRLPFGKEVGLGTIIIGIGILIFSVLAAITLYTEKQVFITVGSVIVIAGLAVGLGMSFHAMLKYNKGIF